MQRTAKLISMFAFLLLACGMPHAGEAGESGQNISWEHILLGPGGGWSAVEIDPNDDNVVYISSDMGNCFRSTDGGKTWFDMTPGMLEAACAGGLLDHTVAVDPLDSNTVYVAPGGVLKSTDGCKTWKLVLDIRAKGGSYNYGPKLTMDPGDSKTLYYSDCSGHIFKTENAGTTWNELKGTGWGQTRKNLLDCINLAVALDHGIYVCMYGRGIYKSAGGDMTWQPFNDGLPHFSILSFIGSHNRVRNHTVFYAMLDMKKNDKGEWQGGLYKREDDAASWTEVPVVDAALYTNRLPPKWAQLAVSPVNPNVVYITADNLFEEWGNNGTYRSLDGGKTWTFLPGEYDRNLLCWGPRVYRYASQYGDVFAVSPKNPMKLFRGDQSCAFRSDDGGKSWQRLSQLDAGNGYLRSTGLEDFCIMTTVVDPKDQRRVYAGAADNGFLKSRDGGKTWKGGDVKGLGVRAPDRPHQILIDPADPSVIYMCHVAELKGRFAVSRDYGDSWENSSMHPEWGLPKQPNILSLALENAGAPPMRVLYAALISEGLYKSVNGGMTWTPWGKGLPEPNKKTQNLVFGQELGRQVIQLVRPEKGNHMYALLAESSRLWHSGVRHGSVKGASLYVSEDCGATWNRLAENGSFPTKTEEIVVDPQDPNVLYAPAMEEGLWASRDAGRMWSKLPFPAPENPVAALAVDRFNSKRLYAAVEPVREKKPHYGIWMSEDGGNTWTPQNKGFGFKNAYKLYADPSSEGVVWASTHGNAIFKGSVPISSRQELLTGTAKSQLEDKQALLKPLTEKEILGKIEKAVLSARFATPGKLGGDLRDPAWNDAIEIDEFYDCQGKTPSEKRTSVKALYDNDFLYLGIHCTEPRMNTVRAPQRERDGAVWKDDSVEIFIARGDQGEVFQFAVNAAGSRMDAAYGKSQLSDISWNASPDWQAAAAMGAGEWSVELAIPWKAIPGKEDQPLKIKICRDDNKDKYNSWPVSIKDSYFGGGAANFGKLELLPCHTEMKINLIQNPGFEELDPLKPGKPAFWNIGGIPGKNVFLVASGHNGKTCGKLVAEDDVHEYSFSTPYLPIKGNTTYTLSFWGKHPEPSRFGMVAQIYFLNENKIIPSQEQQYLWTYNFDCGGPFDWHRFSRSYKAPRQAKYAQICLRLYRTRGSIYFDDVSFTQID